MTPNTPPENLLDVADQLAAKGLHNEAKKWRACAEKYDSDIKTEGHDTRNGALLAAAAVLGAFSILVYFA